jgi:hypothetical protein
VETAAAETRVFFNPNLSIFYRRSKNGMAAQLTGMNGRDALGDAW